MKIQFRYAIKPRMKPKPLPEHKRRTLLNLLKSKHSHSDMELWAKCFDCQQKLKVYQAEKAKMTLEEQEQVNVEIFNIASRLFQGLKAKGLIPKIQDDGTLEKKES